MAKLRINNHERHEQTRTILYHLAFKTHLFAIGQINVNREALWGTVFKQFPLVKFY
jgi:hypothetical protein